MNIASLAGLICSPGLGPYTATKGAVVSLSQALRGTVGISAMILFIILGATTFSQILSFSGATNGLVNAITGSGFARGAEAWSIGGPARAQHPLAALPFDDPAYEVLDGLVRTGCAPAGPRWSR